jgi:pyruvate/2-oxoglutarate/acetoin dehydrogenase E1 component
MTYFDELCRAMDMLAQHPRSIFLGQAVACAGTGMTASFKNVPRDKLLELPVFENCQMGMSIGLSLAGDLPISVYPRQNFLLCAMDQLANHLDKIPLYSAWRPKVIIRTAVCSPVPLDPGPQHLGEHSDAFRLMLKTVEVVQLKDAAEIVPAYRAAMEREGSTILTEYPELYNAGG